MRKTITTILICTLALALAACGGQGQGGRGGADSAAGDAETLVYGSGDYTRINPAMDEHGEINILLFDGLTAHDGDNEIVPGLAREWSFDEASNTYTFLLEENVSWHDGEPFTAADVKFTIEAIMDPSNGSENAANFEDVEEITVVDEHIVTFRLSAPNAAFLDYMTMSILPEHLLAGEDMQEADFFRQPVGTGPYKLASWDEGQAIMLVKNEDYFKGEANIDNIIFKIVTDDNARALQMESGELDLALLTPRDAERFEDANGYSVYNMKTADYRGIMFNFAHEFWQQNRDLIPAVCCAIDRQAIVDAVLQGHGVAAYSPLQMNIYNNEDVERYEYDQKRARQILEEAGCQLNEEGIYERNGEEISFVLSVGAGDQVRLDIAQAVSQQLGEVGIGCSVDIPAQVDWSGQMAYLIGWGSPFDADDHTYKVFGSGQGANYSSYANEEVDKLLRRARQTADPQERAAAYDAFQEALADDPAFAFICYIDADYVAVDALSGIDEETVMGHHGVGIFWNVREWTLMR